MKDEIPYVIRTRYAILIAVVAFLVGCLLCTCVGCGSIQCDFVEAILTSDEVILPEYTAYIMRDESLTSEERSMILEHIERRQRFIFKQLERCR